MTACFLFSKLLARILRYLNIYLEQNLAIMMNTGYQLHSNLAIK